MAKDINGQGASLSTRRRWLAFGAAGGLTVVAGGAGTVAETKNEQRNKRSNKDKDEPKGEDIGPGEDLMREHGVLRRVLLVYQEIARRLDAGVDFDLIALQKSALLVRTFVEDYHERQEEEMVFPRFERAGKLVELVRVLRTQHQAGRAVTARIQNLATSAAVKNSTQARLLRGELLAFVRMYEPHASREDTVLFPALHDLVSRSEYDALGEDFERREHQVFGKDGFENAVAQIDTIEKTLGIEDLAQFTPKG